MKPCGAGGTEKEKDSPGGHLPISWKVIADEINWCPQQEFGFFNHGTSFEDYKGLLRRRISNLTE